MANRSIYDLTWDKHSLKLGRRTCIMGVVNVTPDSFSDGGRYFDRDTAVAQAERMVSQGADIIDVGGESTRPFSDAVSLEEELRRVIPVIKELAKRIGVPISIDTTKAAVARAAIEAGASIINDISALRLDPAMSAVVADSGLPVVLMHMLGTPKTMQVTPAYGDVVAEISAFLAERVQQAVKWGIARNRIIVDPGIGFGKTVDHNLMLIKKLSALQDLDLPILIGPSRKAFIRNLLKDAKGPDLRPDMPIVETGTVAAVCAAVLNGAHIVRVHDVESARAAVRIVDAVLNV